MKLPETNSRPRRDPLTEVVDIDSQQLGYEFLRRKIPYWVAGDVPAQPLGVVPFEVARQFATFLIPLAFVLAVWLIMAPGAVYYAMPVALLIGYLLDLQLTHAVAEKLAAEKAAEQGRYALTRSLCIRLNLKPEEITSGRVVKLAKDYMASYRRLMGNWKAIQEAAASGLVGARTGNGSRSLAAIGAGAAVAGAVYADDTQDTSMFPQTSAFDHDYNTPDYSSQDTGYYPEVNTNGTPMIADTFVDVSGNAYGFD